MRQGGALLELIVIASLSDVDNGSENRTAIRLPMSLPVKARFGGTTHNLVTLNVSVDGAFIVTPQPPERGQLVKLTFILATSTTPVVLQGIVIRTVEGEEARKNTIPAGMGIQYYGLGQGNQTAWEDFFHQAIEDHINAGGVLHPPTPSLVGEKDSLEAIVEEASADFDIRSTPHYRKEGDNFYDEPTKPFFSSLAKLEELPDLEDAPEVGVEAEQERDTDVEAERERDTDVEADLVVAEDHLPVVHEAPHPEPETPPPIPWKQRDQMIVEVSMKPTARIHPDGSNPALFRILPLDIEGVRRLRFTAFKQGGVMIAGAGRRPTGTLAVVAVVHPMTGGEFHIPGEVDIIASDQQLIPIRFLGVTRRTKQEFEAFVESGTRTPCSTGLSSSSPDGEMVLFYSAEEAQKDFTPESKGAVLIGVTLPFTMASGSKGTSGR